MISWCGLIDVFIEHRQAFFGDDAAQMIFEIGFYQIYFWKFSDWKNRIVFDSGHADEINSGHKFYVDIIAIKALFNPSPEVVQGNVMDELKIIAFDLLKNLWIIFLKLKLWWWFFILELQWNKFFDLIKFFDWIELLLTNQIYAASDRRVNGLSHRTHKRGFIFEVTVDGFFRHGEFTGDVVHGDALEPKVQE